MSKIKLKHGTNAEGMPVWTGAVMIPLDLIDLNPWNPNVMDDATFNRLMLDIEADGFDEPLQVVETKDKRYMVIGGEHRLKVGRALGWERIPCVIKSWDQERVQMEKTVRRNILRGDLDAGKFNALVNTLKDKFAVDEKELSDRFGFKQETDMRKVLAEVEKRKADLDKAFRDSREPDPSPILDADKGVEGNTVDSLTSLLNEILSEAGDDLGQGYVAFMYRGRQHLLVEGDETLREVINRTQARLRRTGEPAAKFVARVLARALDEELEAMS